MWFREIIDSLRRFLPLTYPDIITRTILGANTILDVGCGRGELMAFVKSRIRVFSVGVDIYLSYINKAKKKEIHNEYVRADARFLPFRPKSFDAVLCSQVIEHLQRDKGLKLIEMSELIAKYKVVIGTPVGYVLPGYLNGNPLLIHKSGYFPSEFEDKGYSVKGQGLRQIYGSKGLAHKLPKRPRVLTYIISYLLSPLTYKVPLIATHFIAVKSRRQKDL